MKIKYPCIAGQGLNSHIYNGRFKSDTRNVIPFKSTIWNTIQDYSLVILTNITGTEEQVPDLQINSIW